MSRHSWLGLFCLWSLQLAGGAATPEEAFVSRMREADLTGTWIPLRGDKLGAEKPDTYRVVRASRREGDQWEIVWRVSHRGQPVEMPLPCTVTFAGDVAVLILDNMEMGEGRRYSARVMFHENVYTGRWWSAAGDGGLLNGTVAPGADGGQAGS